MAAALLAGAILPAEYGIDPLGTGKAFGLTGLSKAAEATTGMTGTPASAAGATIAPVLIPGKHASRWGEVADMRGAFIAQPRQFNVDARDLTLAPGEGMEIKYHLAKGAGLIYSWTATAPVLYDFHGQPDIRPPGETDEDYFQSYEQKDAVGATEAHGTLIAPTTGIHGWFWENAGGQAVTIRLVSSGYYDWVFQNRDETISKFKPTDIEAIPRHPKIPDEPL